MLGPSAAAMAAAQSIMAAQAYQAQMQAQAQLQAQQQQQQAQVQVQAAAAAAAAAAQNQKAAALKDLGPDYFSELDEEELQRTLHVTNVSRILTLEQLKQLFAFCGNVSKCEFLSEDKTVAQVRFLKTDEAQAALALNNMSVGDKQLKVELAKTAKEARDAAMNAKAAPPAAPAAPALGIGVGALGVAAGTPGVPGALPLQMQQAMAMPLMQFQQAIMMQQALAQQNKGTDAKTAAELAAKRAKEIGKMLGTSGGGEGEGEDGKGRRRRRDDDDDDSDR